MNRRREPPSTLIFLVLLMLPIIAILLSLIRSRVTVPPFTEKDRVAYQRQLEWPIYMEEHFEDDDDSLCDSSADWGLGYEFSDDYDLTRCLGNGQWVWWVKYFSPESDVNTRWLITELPLEDFVLTTDLQNYGGSKRLDYGIIFNYQDDENYYTLTINEGGEINAARTYRGNRKLIFPTMSVSQVIHPYDINQLTFSFEDGQGLILVNEQYVTQFKDTRISQGHLGFVIEIPAGWDGATIVYIDNFILRIPDQTGGGD